MQFKVTLTNQCICMFYIIVLAFRIESIFISNKYCMRIFDIDNKYAREDSNL
jgi:hypothetical protein